VAVLLKITLTVDQAAALEPLLVAHRQRTGITGLFAAITRSYRSETQGVTVELQLIPLNRRLTAAITKAARD
jgi:hypothetical protein